MAVKIKQIPLVNSEIPSRLNPASRVLRAVVITNNDRKFEEFCTQLSDGYGMDVLQWKTEEGLDLENESILIQICEKIMATQQFSPHFILREETGLMNRRGDDLTNIPLDELAKRKLEPVTHTSTLKVFKPEWTSEIPAEKKLAGFTLRHCERRSEGYIAPGKTNLKCEHGFGWDAIFVNAATNLTNEQYFDRYGKKSARQHNVSDFIVTYLRYKALVSLQHHQLPLTKPIDFGHDYYHLSKFVKEEKHFSNPHIADWGVENLRSAMINNGMFVKGAWTRPVRTYFSPPFSGLPLTGKKDEGEESIFMTHDKLHHLICDLICDTEPTKENFHIYSAWRMTSEACTLVLADMLYADGLVKSGFPRSCVDSRIYPLFEAIVKAQNLPDVSSMSKEAKNAFIQKLLYANVKYALLGDDSEWVKLLTPSQGAIADESLKCLKAYKDHFGKFFIGDNAWTRANFDNMHKQNQPLKEWIAAVGKEEFRQSSIPLLSDVSVKIAANNPCKKDYKEIVDSVFNLVFDGEIKPRLEKDKVELDDDEIIQSRAFRRFLIGQSSLFSRYPTPPNLSFIKKEIFKRIKDSAPFPADEQDRIRAMLEHYIRGIEGQGLMSADEANNAIDCFPVFPPVYISYPKMQTKYGTIENCVRDCVENYPDKSKPVIAGLPYYGESRDLIFAEKKVEQGTADLISRNCTA